MNAVELESVTKKFGSHTAVKQMDFSVPVGGIHGFIGPNGSGKTTTLRMILRILFPDAGTVRVLGRTSEKAADDRVGYLPEERGLYRKMKTFDAVRFHTSLKGAQLSRAEIRQWLARFDLGQWADKNVEALSKGMAQRLQFLTAVAHQPELVVLDEPMSGLDPVSAEFIAEEILSLKDAGKTVLLSTHDMDAAARLCDTLLMIHRGRKILDGTLDEIRSAHGAETLKVRCSLKWEDIVAIDGVQGATQRGSFIEISLSEGLEPARVLQEMVGRGQVEHFEIATSTLRDIFVRLARTENADHG